jgi:tetratricopeptide (TPR) repeat protein
MAIAFGAIVIVTGLVALIQLRPSGRSPDMKDLSLAVLDFRDLVSPNDPATAAGITALVNVGLTESSSIRVISPEYIYDIRRRIFGSGRGAMDEDQRMTVARKSGSTLFLAAEISGTQGERYVAWRLVDTSSGKNLGAHRVEGKTLAEIADRIIEGVMPLLPRGAGGKTPASPSSVGTLATSSEEAYRCYVKGLLALEQYRDQDAIAEFERAVAVDSSFALAYYHLAYAHYKLSLSMQGLPRGYTEKAWSHRDRLGVRERMSVEAFRYLLDGDWSGSIRAYREILARWPDDRTTLGILSRNLFMGWWYDQALSISQQGLALYPDETVLQVVYQNGLAFLGRREEALAASRGFVKAHPDKEYLLNELGQRYWEVGMPDSAEAVFQRVLLLHPGDWLAQQSISSCYYSRGDVNGTIGMLERLVKRPDLLDDQRRRVFVVGFAGGLAALPAEIGRYEHSFEFLREYKSCESASEATAAVIEARLLQTMGRAQEAVDSARTRLKRVSTSNDSVVIELAMTEALAEAGSTEEARSTLSRIRESDENNLWGRNRFRALLLPCIIALAEGDAARALELVHELERFGKPPATELAVYYREALARSYWKSGRLEDAVRAYADLLNIFGGHAVSHYELGQVYEQMGRPADAKREYGKFLEMWSEADEGLPQLVDARQRLARL